MNTKEAIQIALDYIKEVYSNASDFLVEEIELSENEKSWNITISFPEPDVKGSFAASILGNPRKYKTIYIDAESRKVKAMKIRTIK